MSFVGGYLGGTPAGGGETPTPPLPPIPVPVPVVFGDPEYLGYVAMGLDRICEQFRGDPEELAFPVYLLASFTFESVLP